METKMLEFSLVLKKLSLTEDQLNRAIKKIEKTHPFEEWIVLRDAPNMRDKIIYLRQEFVLWLEEVKYNPDGFHLDRDIAFFEKQILRLEQELGLPHHEEKYSSATIKELSEKTYKKIPTIRKGVQKMTQALGTAEKSYKDREVIISANGVKWLDQKYFREDYLRRLGRYKRSLQDIKRKKI